jgi:glucose-6-phosphate isomerase
MDLERIKELKKRLEKEYMAHPDVLSIGIGLSSAGKAAVIVAVRTGRKGQFFSMAQDPDIELREADFYETM